MTDSRWAIAGKVFTAMVLVYVALWLTMVLLTTVDSVGDTRIENAFIECRASSTVYLFPDIKTVQGKPMEFCETWAKEHP